MTVRGIVLIEGADSAGKTTLARHLVETHGAKYIHSTTRKNVWRWHVGALRVAVAEARKRLVVLDRLHFSELVYGAVFCGGPEPFGFGPDGIGARSIDRVLRRYGAVTVLCVPADQQRQVARWEEGRENGKHEHFDGVRAVIAQYADLRHGNVAHPGSGYLAQLIRFGDFTDRDDVLVYDLDHHQGPKGIATMGKIIVGRLATLRRQTILDIGDNLSGRSDINRPRWLFVGDAADPASAKWATPRWPWCDRDGRVSAAGWLNQTIHHLALREDRLTFVNADPGGDGDYLPWLLDTHADDRVIALGLKANERIRALGHRANHVTHPQAHRRFHYNEGPQGYAEILREVIRGNDKRDRDLARALTEPAI